MGDSLGGGTFSPYNDYIIQRVISKSSASRDNLIGKLAKSRDLSGVYSASIEQVLAADPKI